MIKVLLVDDSPFIRRIFKNIIERDPELTVVATAKMARRPWKNSGSQA